MKEEHLKEQLTMRQQLTMSKNFLTKQLKEEQIELNEAEANVTRMAEQIAAEQQQMDEFKVERNDPNTMVIVLLGMTGGGKSTFSNRLAGDTSKRGNEGPSKASSGKKLCTQENSKQIVKFGGEQITVVDTPG